MTFLSELRRLHSTMVIDSLNLWETDLPEFNGRTIAAKYAKLAGRAMTPEEAAAWEQIREIVERLRTSDALVVATPMWNFGIPYKLKHWIDLITQPGLTFTFDPVEGYLPLLQPRPTLVVLSSAGDYSKGPSRGRPDLASPYLQEAFKFIGLSDVKVVLVGPTVGLAEQVAHARTAADQYFTELAATFMGSPS
jgi:FMN-dependent NADH-azoreductase